MTTLVRLLLRGLADLLADPLTHTVAVIVALTLYVAICLDANRP